MLNSATSFIFLKPIFTYKRLHDICTLEGQYERHVFNYGQGEDEYLTGEIQPSGILISISYFNIQVRVTHGIK